MIGMLRLFMVAESAVADMSRNENTLTCDWGACERRAVSFRFDERLGDLIPVCWRHITAYRIGKGGTGLWQAEDEYAGLRFCRRARWRWLAQIRILADQRAAMAGRVSRAQARLLNRTG